MESIKSSCFAKHNPANLPPMDASAHDEQILLVDDDPDHLQLLEEYIAAMGLASLSASGGVQAIEVLQSNSFAIVVSDIKMPEVDGVALLNFVKEHAPSTDVILVTGYSEKYSFTDIINEGATDYLEKPFNRDALKAKISRIFKERKATADRQKAEDILKEKSIALSCRVKELDCLYNISRLIDQNETELENIFPQVVSLIPPALRYPDLAAVRFVCQGKEYASASLQEKRCSMSQEVIVNREKIGILEIYYDENRGDSAGAPLLDEEKNLLSEIAYKLGQIIQRQQSVEKMSRLTEELHLSHQNLEQKVLQRTQDLHESQAELLTVFESVPDGIISVDTSMTVLHKNDQCMADLHIQIGSVFQPGTSKFQQECYRILLQSLEKQEPVSDYRLEFNKGSSKHQAFLVSTSCFKRSSGSLKGAVLVIHDMTKVVLLENQLHERRQYRQIIGESNKMKELYQLVRQVASVDTTILITGESGVGKEMIVDTLHAMGDRSSKPLVKVNCSALPENLLESELFGHVRGAFTGASQNRTGRIQLAEGGILFLDEIGDISSRLQLQLLRFLELKEFEIVGESQKRTADVRVFAATNANLVKKVADGSFRADLYYRLKVMVIHVPPVRERREDIQLLLEHFIGLFNKKFHKQVTGVEEEVGAILRNHNWQGNVREIKHAVEHAVLLCQGDILKLEHFPKELLVHRVETNCDMQPARALTRDKLLAALNDSQWHRTKTAKLLKVSRATLYNKLKEFGLSPGQPPS